MLNIIVSILVGVSIYCVVWVRTLKHVEEQNDKIIDNLKDIIVLKINKLKILNIR